MTLRIGIDIGGTFTDLVAISRDGRVTTHKTASTPHDYGEGIIDGLQALLAGPAGHGRRRAARHHRRIEHRAGGQGRAEPR